MPTSIANNVWWVGARHEKLRVFDIVMQTSHGTTYNAYLVKGEHKTALIDCVKRGFEAQLLDALQQLTDIAKLDYVVVNHSEPDHSGALSIILDEAKDAEVVGTRVGLGFVSELLNRDFKRVMVKNGDSIELGGKTLRFLETPFLHWPDTMMTYVVEEGVLLSCDAFGCHFAEGGVFDDEAGICLDDAQKYYFDVIISPYKKYARDMLEKTSPLDIRAIGPSHGPVYRADPRAIMAKYASWAEEYEPNEKPTLLIAYVSSYGFTKALANAVERGAKDIPGVNVTMLDIAQLSPAQAAATCELADALAIGSPTFNRDVLPPVYAMLGALSPLRSAKKPAACFGDFGWSGEAVALMEARLEKIGYKLMPGMRARLNPTAEALEQARLMGEALAREIAGA